MGTMKSIRAFDEVIKYNGTSIARVSIFGWLKYGFGVKGKKTRLEGQVIVSFGEGQS